MSTQSRQISNLISQGVDGIVINAASTSGLNGVVQQACDRGITIVSFDNTVDNACGLTVNTDQIKFGEQLAQFIVDKLNGQGNVVMVTGVAGTGADNDRNKGAKAVFAANPGIKVVATYSGMWDSATAQRVTSAQLPSLPKVDGVWVSGGTDGVIKAFGAANRPMPVVGGEAENGFRKYMAGILTPKVTGMSIGQPPFLSVISLELARAVIKGEHPKESITIPFPVVTSDNELKPGETVFPDLPDSFFADFTDSGPERHRDPVPGGGDRRDAVPGHARRQPRHVMTAAPLPMPGLSVGTANPGPSGADVVAVRATGVDRAFGGVQALRDASFAARPGEIHALAGENGAGKSTLIKVLCGLISADRGTVEIFGQEVRRVVEPAARRRLGVATAFQELSLLPDLTVAENLLLQDPPRGRLGLVRRGRLAPAADAILRRYGVDHIDSRAVTADLSVAHRQVVELVRVLATEPRVVILDEPTAALPAEQVAVAGRAHAAAARRGLLRHLHLPPLAGDRGPRRPGDRVPQRHPGGHPRPAVRGGGGDADERAQLRGRLPRRHGDRRAATARCGSTTSPAAGSAGCRSTCAGARSSASAASPGQGQRDLFLTLFGARRAAAGTVARRRGGGHHPPAQGRDPGRPRHRLRARGPQGRRAVPAAVHPGQHRAGDAVAPFVVRLRRPRRRADRGGRRSSRSCASAGDARPARRSARCPAATSRRSSWPAGCSPTPTCCCSTT